MARRWLESKQRLMEVVRKVVQKGLQIATRHSRAALTVKVFVRLTGGRSDFKQALRLGPDLGALSIVRDRRPAPRATL